MSIHWINGFQHFLVIKKNVYVFIAYAKKKKKKTCCLHQTFSYIHFSFIRLTQSYWVPALCLALFQNLGIGGDKTNRCFFTELTVCCGSWILFQDACSHRIQGILIYKDPPDMVPPSRISCPLPIFKFPQTSSNQSHVVPWALNHRGNLNCHFFTCFVPEYARRRDNWPWTDWTLHGAIPPSVSGVPSCPRWDPFTWGSLLFPSSVLTGDLDTQICICILSPSSLLHLSILPSTLLFLLTISSLWYWELLN